MRAESKVLSGTTACFHGTGTCVLCFLPEAVAVPGKREYRCERAAEAVCFPCWAMDFADVLELPSLGLSYRLYAAVRAHKLHESKPGCSR